MAEYRGSGGGGGGGGGGSDDGATGAPEPPFATLVVDIGANDGFLSSNSYNLAQWGWSTVLVEPNPAMLKMAKEAQDPFIDPYGEGRQKACYVNAGMAGSAKATTMRLKMGNDVVSMESSLEAASSGSGGGSGSGGKVGGTFHVRYFAVKSPIDDSRYCPFNQSGIPWEWE
jgi:hypothetical protein